MRKRRRRLKKHLSLPKKRLTRRMSLCLSKRPSKQLNKKRGTKRIKYQRKSSLRAKGIVGT